MTYTFKMLDGEFWWGGCANEGTEQPFGCTSSFHHEYSHECQNQGMPLYLSNKGRYIWSEDAFDITIKDGVITIESDLDVAIHNAGSSLKEAYLAAKDAHFPFSGKVPEHTFFTTAQYNTWMEFTYNPTQEGVLEYAHAIVDSGFIPGILIIDEGWHNPYGDWTFDKLKFPDPKAMVDELHSLGFKVMLWVVPYVTCSGFKYVSEVYPYANFKSDPNKLFLRNENGEVALVRWWNGISAILDLTEPYNCEFLDKQLRALMKDYGIDGFKFDGGSRTAYHNKRVVNGPYRGTSEGKYSPLAQNIAWNEFGARYPYHEYKDTYKGGGKPTIQRLCDRGHRWEHDGINTIIPNSLCQGLLGHPFICPDMIGGGEWTFNVMPDCKIDEELFIRMTQVSVFFPMMQFSWAPWRVLSKESWETVAKFGRMHAELSDEILKIIEESAVTGEPVIRYMEYEYPNCGYEKITDQYFCGKDILVCPIVTKGTFEKDVVIPKGKWIDEFGNIYEGGVHRIKTPIDRLPYFRKMNQHKSRVM